MNITENERKTAEELIEKFIKYKESLPYANIGKQNEYLGWVADFRLTDSSNRSISLDLKKENDLFLLFVLAIVWSRTGQWENSAFFVAYLKIYGKDTVQFWNNESNYRKEQDFRESTAELIAKELTGYLPRKKISFRKDIFVSINLLAMNWQQILDKLEISEKEVDFEIFMKYLRNIEGLGVGDRRILIKIPLILRELRCQKIYSNISGELCCVPDDRVFKAGKKLNIQIPKASNMKNLKDSSSKIYQLFGDLYDLPLFAYNDLKKLP
jgi:hypothetical protein